MATTKTNDEQQFYAAIEASEWYEAAVILLRHCDTREDPQDWLSAGDVRYIVGQPLAALAAEWDAMQRQARDL